MKLSKEATRTSWDKTGMRKLRSRLKAMEMAGRKEITRIRGKKLEEGPLYQYYAIILISYQSKS